MVPADEVEQLVAGGELDLPKPLEGLDAGGELDLVAVRIEPTARARVRPDDPAAPAEQPHVVRETAQGALDEDVSGRHIQVQLLAPQGATQVRQPAAREAFNGR